MELTGRRRRRLDGFAVAEARGERLLREVAAQAGISESYLSQLETGARRGCRLATRRRIAGALGVALDVIETDDVRGEDVPA